MNHEKAFLKFIDRDKRANLSDGIEFFAVGLIVANHMVNGVTPTGSGKDYAVEYIDPFGVYNFEWRAQEDIEISAISEGDYENLKACFDRVELARRKWTPADLV
ncbi:hypothetical protein [Paraburkholderia sp. SIMBA_054]|uniref:hypothetical protein n=1 Tax=Paraburkholderia sp. SIMBA_054 TaxID=3085795 RepID=UPI00397E1101